MPRDSKSKISLIRLLKARIRHGIRHPVILRAKKSSRIKPRLKRNNIRLKRPLQRNEQDTNGASVEDMACDVSTSSNSHESTSTSLVCFDVSYDYFGNESTSELDGDDEEPFYSLPDKNKSSKSEVFVLDLNAPSSSSPTSPAICNGEQDSQLPSSSTKRIGPEQIVLNGVKQRVGGAKNFSFSDEERVNLETSDEGVSFSEKDYFEKPNCRLYSPQSDGFFLLLGHPLAISMQGKIQIKVLVGCLDVNGFLIKPTGRFFPIYSPISNSRMVLSTYKVRSEDTLALDDETRKIFVRDALEQAKCSNESITEILKDYKHDSVIVQCKELTDPVGSYLLRYFPSLYRLGKDETVIRSLSSSSDYGCAFRRLSDCKAINTDIYWKQIACDVINNAQMDDSPPRIVVCGGKRVGKSTFCRYLINAILNLCEKVCYLEGDPGQTEFTPPGLLSLVEVSEPCFGPSFTHQKTPEKALFLGAVSPAEGPTHYVKCIQDLFKLYLKSDLKRQPLLINTMGWSRGVGVALLADMIHMTQPTFVIQIESVTFPGRNFPALSAEFVCSCQGWAIGAPKLNQSYHHYIIKSLVEVEERHFIASKMRQVGLLTYLCNLQPPAAIRHFSFKPINHLPSHKIPWASVALRVCHEDVPNSQILYAYNASIVALCKCDATQMISTTDPTLPKFLCEMPIGECFGYGIVRGICMKEKCFYVITAVAAERLSKVNALLKGGVDVPMALLTEQDVSTRIPYVSTRKVTSPLVLGSKVVSSRAYRKSR